MNLELMNPELIYPYGEAQVTGVIKNQAEDFRVDENLGFNASGDGEHLLIQVEKTGLTTVELIDYVARDFDIKPHDVGYSGHKDKLAVTRQWLSLHLPGRMNSLEIPTSTKYRLLEHSWHNRKLRPGAHRSNSFQVVVRDVGDYPAATQSQIDQISISGFANYFGEQRFGRGQDNVAQALHHFTNARRSRKLSRTRRSLYLSALRSFLFNRVLSRRIESGYWAKPVSGDVFMLAGSHSIFYEAISADIIQRYQQLDLSSTVSLYGSGSRLLELEAAELEDQVIASYPDIAQCLLDQGAKLQMRNTRALVEDFEVDYDQSENMMMIKATLPAGCYFTTLLNHFVDTSLHR